MKLPNMLFSKTRRFRSLSNTQIMKELFEDGIIDSDEPAFIYKKPALINPINMSKVEGMLLGNAIGDSLGNTSEGKSVRLRNHKYGIITEYLPNANANYASKIIEPIQSRCVVFRFKPLTEEEMKECIARMVKGENLDIDEKAINALIYVGDGDVRKLTNILQSSALQSNRITEQSIYEVAARARPKEIITMLKSALDGNFDAARAELDNLMLKQGMSAEDILTQCYREVQSLGVDERKKLGVVVQLGEANFRVVEGANERIQLEAMLAHLALIGKEK